MKHLEELERQLMSSESLDLAKITDLQVLDILQVGNSFVQDMLDRQSENDEAILGGTSV